jgi:hypothetical protein
VSEQDQTFATFDQWVSQASTWLTRRDSGGQPQGVLCVDAAGRVCRLGKHFMRARDEGTFPVRWYWPDQCDDLVVTVAPRSDDDRHHDHRRALQEVTQ